MAKNAECDYDIIIVGAGTAGCVLANRLSEDPAVSVLILEAGGDHSNDEQTIVQPSDDVKKELNIAHSDANIRESKGPIQASFPERVTSLRKTWVDTFRTLGLENHNDPLDGHALGGHTSTCHITAGQRERSHAGVAYLEPALVRDNIKVVTNALVEKLMMERQNSVPVVRGVRYMRDGQLCGVSARKEVVLAAGTFNTPQILELSGIGNPKVLSQHGIDIVVANPAVGENLQDHLRPRVGFECNEDVPARNLMAPEEARKLYEQDRSGPWAEAACSFSYTPLLPFLDSRETDELLALLEEHLKDDEHCSPFTRKRNAFIRKTVESPNEATAVSLLVRAPVAGAPEGSNYLTLCAMLSHPFSAGCSHITSGDPQVKPRVNFNYYSHPLDLEIHARQIQILKKLARTEPLASYIKPGGFQLPVEHPADTVESAKELCRAYSSTNYHPCGTCALGEVVDGRLRVKGVTNLRVADASVIPIMTRGNIITAVYAVGERAADIISEDLYIRRHTYTE